MARGFGIVGLGMIAEFHARAIEGTGKGRLVACCSRSQDRAEAFASRWGGRGYSSIQEFLRHPDLEVVTICTPSGAHLEPALAAAEAGKHLVVEKPLEITLERCDRLIEACARKGVTLAGIFPSRFLDLSPVLKRAITGGRFGRITMGSVYAKYYRTQEYYDGSDWKGTWRYDGGGALMNQGIHAIDYLQWLMGPVESILAMTGVTGHTGIEVEDTACAVLRYRSGAFGVIEGTTAAYPGFQQRIELCGTEGSAVLVHGAVEQWSFRTEALEDREIRERFAAVARSGGGASDPGGIDPLYHQRQIEDFLLALESGGRPLVDGVEARKSVEIILGIYESARSGRKVRLGA